MVSTAPASADAPPAPRVPATRGAGGPSGRLGVAWSAATVLVAGLALYAPTLLRDVGTWDTAEFQAVGPVLGIAHPTGYPTYTLLAWLASVVLQPFGNEALRANLLSALLMAGAGALAAIATVQLTARPVLGVLSGLVFVVTPVAWGTAVRADAHALHAFLAGLLLVLLLGWQRRERVVGVDVDAVDPGGDPPEGRRRSWQRPGAWLVAAAVVFGLSLGNHALTLLLAPGVAVFVLLVAPTLLWRRPALVASCVAALALTSVLVYAYIPVRSSMGPPLDYAEPRTWESFWYLVLGQQFQGSMRPLPDAPAIARGVWDEVSRNLGPLALLVPVGLVAGLVRHRAATVMGLLWFASTWLFAMGYPNASIGRYYLVPLLVASVWLALAADAAWDILRRRTRARGTQHDPAGVGAQRVGVAVATVLLGVLFAVAVAPLPERWRAADLSGDTFGRAWLDATLAALDEDAVVVSWWSFSTPLWYGRWVEDRRPDILVIDDRDVLDDGYGTAEGAVDAHLGRRPVYVVRLEADLARMAERYQLSRVDGVPGPGDLYRVVGRLPDDPAPGA